jgi:hypothetical protein
MGYELISTQGESACAMRYGYAGTIIGLLLCAVASWASAAQPRPAITFAVFGDSGYHYKYEPYLEGRYSSPQAYARDVNERWTRAGYRRDEYDIPPPHYDASSESFVPASGVTAVAAEMHKRCARLHCGFAIMVGDNIYPNGATLGQDGRLDDDRFADILTEPFSPLAGVSPDFSIFAALGNHDWGTSLEGAKAQVAFLQSHRPFYMAGFFYRVQPPGTRNEVELFVIDTTLLLASMSVDDTMAAGDAREKRTNAIADRMPWASQPQVLRERVAWLETALASSRARWKIVVGHHPLWQSPLEPADNSLTLATLLLPTLCRYADVYLSGHEHSLEIHETPCARVQRDQAPLPLIVSGAASKMRPASTRMRRIEARALPGHRVIWAQGTTWGFALIELGVQRATVTMIKAWPEAGHGGREQYIYRFRKRSRVSSAPADRGHRNLQRQWT